MVEYLSVSGYFASMMDREKHNKRTKIYIEQFEKAKLTAEMIEANKGFLKKDNISLLKALMREKKLNREMRKK